MVAIVGTPKVVGAADTTFTLANGSTSGRAVLILAWQARNTVNLTGFSFNSAAGTTTTSTDASNLNRAVVSYWQDADLPAGAGTYNVARSSAITGGTEYVIFELSGVDNATAPEILPVVLAANGWTSPLSIDFSNASAGDFLGVTYIGAASFGDATALSGQTVWGGTGPNPISAKIATGANESLGIGNLNTTGNAAYIGVAFPTAGAAGPDYTQRKGSTFTASHTLGTITTATLNAVNVFDHVSTQAAGTISFTGSVTDERTTSGVVDLVLGDGAATQTQTVQVNVFGVVPSNNPAQKDGSALASLTGIQIRITAGANLNGTQVYYSPTETTDASGNFSTLDVSTSAAVAADPVRMQVLTAAGDSITSAETVELI
jgi:hypothetical protein